MTVQIIKKDDKPEWAVLPYKEYLLMIKKAEMAEDLKDYDEVKTALEQGDEELIPGEVVYAIMEGSNPIKIWREFRGKSQQETAEKVGISVPYLSQLETNKRKGSLEVLAAIAKTLDVSLDMLVLG